MANKITVNPDLEESLARLLAATYYSGALGRLATKEWLEGKAEGAYHEFMPAARAFFASKLDVA